MVLVATKPREETRCLFDEVGTSRPASPYPLRSIAKVNAKETPDNLTALQNNSKPMEGEMELTGRSVDKTTTAQAIAHMML